MENLIPIISIAFTAVSACWAVIVYRKQQQLIRLQNIISVFQRFSNNDDFIDIFNLGDICYVTIKNGEQQFESIPQITQLASIPTEKKLKYLALLEEIAILAKNFSIIHDSAIHLFKFHFYYVYGDNKISEAFWQNIGSGITEKHKEGWSYQMDFANKCIKNIE